MQAEAQARFITARPLRSGADIWSAVGVATLACLAFLNTLWNGFVLDDTFIIVENAAIRHLSDLRAIFAAPYWPDPAYDLLYRPLVIFSYAVNYAVAGLAPVTYHLVNILLHAGNSALVTLIFLALFRRLDLAIVGGAAFALHPIHTEAVANVVGRAELLANAFLLLSWLWYLRRDEAPPRARTGWLVVSVGAFGLALFSKEHAVILLGLLILTDLVRAAGSGLRPGPAVWEKCRTAYAWYLVPLAGYLLARILVLGRVLDPQIGWLSNPLAYADPWTRCVTATRIIGKYLWLLLVPIRLSPDYSYNQIPVTGSLGDPAVLASQLGLLLSAVAAVWTWRRQPAIGAGVALFAVTILPVSNLPFPIGTIMAERLLYLPSIGFCLLLAVATATVAARPRWRRPAVIALVLVLAGYGTRTVFRNRDWRSNTALFEAAGRTSPNSASVHNALGWARMKQGDLAGARQEFERSLAIFPGYGDAYNNLGLVLAGQGQLDEAIRAYRAATRLDPEHRLAHINLGFVYQRKGMGQEALEEFRVADRLGVFRLSDLNLLAKGFFLVGSLTDAAAAMERARYHSPNTFFLRHNLGLVYSRQGRWEEALLELQAAARLKSDSPEVQMNLGRAYAARGMLAEAEAALKDSLRLRPGDPDVLSLLAAVFIQQARLDDAERAVGSALRLQSGHAEARYNLGVIFEKRGDPRGAQRQFEEALRLRPEFPAAHRALGLVLRERGEVMKAQRELKIAEQQQTLSRSEAQEGAGRPGRDSLATGAANDPRDARGDH